MVHNVERIRRLDGIFDSKTEPLCVPMGIAIIEKQTVKVIGRTALSIHLIEVTALKI